MTESVAVKMRTSPLRRLYNWVLRNAEGPHAWAALAAIAFAEASFFPIIPDVIMAPMVLANRKRAFAIAGWCALWSVVGGALGYAIGSVLYDSVGRWLISLYHLGADFDNFRVTFASHPWWILFQGMTPIPYKLVTIAAGFAAVPFPLFMLFSAITRGTRFLFVATLLYFFGEPVRAFLERWLEYVLVGVLAAIVIGYLVWRYMI